MTLGPLPTLHYRRRQNGTAIFRVLETPEKRLELQQIAVLKPDGTLIDKGSGPTTTERQEITTFTDAAPEILTTLNHAAQWVQAEAEDSSLRSHAQEILLAIHDLRSTLVKRLARQPK